MTEKTVKRLREDIGMMKTQEQRDSERVAASIRKKLPI